MERVHVYDMKYFVKKLIMFMAICWAPADAGAQQGTLLLSEILFQPRSGEAEYVELYNPTDITLELAAYHIVRVLHDSLGAHFPLPSYAVGPHEYVALSKDVASVAACYRVRYASRLVECNLPPYHNGGGSVVLATADSMVVQRLDYSPAMHSRLLRGKAGVSLERRSFERDANEQQNWFSASSVAGYGTPGYENSQSTERLVEEASFVFSSDIVSPDADGYQDALTIEYALDDGTLAARCEVYDGRGRVVRRLLNGDLLGTHGAIVWDGLGSDGQRLPQGQYVVSIAVYDPAGTRQTLRRAVALMYR